VTAATSALIDTSVVIALAHGEELSLPERVAISAVTLCGLHHGVLVAGDDVRAGRLAVLVEAERTFHAIPVDSRVAPHYGRLVAETRSRFGARPRVADALIAATAISRGLQLVTRDRDFDRMSIPDLRLV
jgi:predicted nucleic acid-binding protein